ncbi:MAG: site-specific integrase [Sulfitobacter sp.]|uniref:site-specific integrase n=1 Tax=Alphaproteobacteria TaxID=28211 RepID=UPI00326333CE
MSLKLYKRGKVFHIRGSVAGRQFRCTTGTSDRKKAERVKAEIEQGAWQRRFDGPGAGLTMAQAFIAYLEAGKPDRFIARLNDYWGDVLVENIKPETIKRAARKVYPDATGATRNRQVIAPTVAAINYAAELGWCSRIKASRFHVDAETKTPADLAWVNAFASQATGDGLPHLAALCLFMFATGARVGEGCKLTWADVDLQSCKATIRMKKPTPWKRTAHLPGRVVAALANIGGNRNLDARVFGYAGTGSVTKVWNNVVARAEIDALTPHSCRHGFATTMLRKGIDVKTVADRGGWKDPMVVLRTYAHALEDQTVTDAVFDTESTHGVSDEIASDRNVRRKSV